MSTNKHTCDRCGAADTTVHLTQVIDGKVTKLHLCEACAAAAGIDMEKTISITDILLGLDGEEQPAAAAAEVDVVCSACGISRSEYRKRGRLGCPECYHSFRRDLMPVIKSMQQGVKHRGVGRWSILRNVESRIWPACECSCRKRWLLKTMNEP